MALAAAEFSKLHAPVNGAEEREHDGSIRDLERLDGVEHFERLGRILAGGGEVDGLARIVGRTEGHAAVGDAAGETPLHHRGRDSLDHCRRDGFLRAARENQAGDDEDVTAIGEEGIAHIVAAERAVLSELTVAGDGRRGRIAKTTCKVRVRGKEKEAEARGAAKQERGDDAKGQGRGRWIVSLLFSSPVKTARPAQLPAPGLPPAHIQSKKDERDGPSSSRMFVAACSRSSAPGRFDTWPAAKRAERRLLPSRVRATEGVRPTRPGWRRSVRGNILPDEKGRGREMKGRMSKAGADEMKSRGRDLAPARRHE